MAARQDGRDPSQPIGCPCGMWCASHRSEILVAGSGPGPKGPGSQGPRTKGPGTVGTGNQETNRFVHGRPGSERILNTTSNLMTHSIFFRVEASRCNSLCQTPQNSSLGQVLKTFAPSCQRPTLSLLRLMCPNIFAKRHTV